MSDDLPSGWHRHRLSDVADIFNGKAGGTGGTWLRVFKTRHVYDGFLRLTDPAFAPDDKASKVPLTTYLRTGDTLTPNMAHGTIGRVSFVRSTEDHWTVDGQVMVIRAKPPSTLGRYLYDWMSRPESKAQLVSLEKGGAFDELRGQTHIYPTDVGALSVLVPPLHEQAKIAAILSSVDEAIEATQAVIEQLQILKMAMMPELLTRGLPGRHTRFKQTEIGVVPEEWAVTSLGATGQWLSGGTPSKREPSLWSGPVPWVSPKDMKRPRIDDAIDHVSKEALQRGTQLAPVGSVLMVVRGMILAHTFPVAVATGPVAFNQDIKALVPGHDFESEFILFWLQYRAQEVLSLTDVSNHGTKRLPSERLFESKLPKPPLVEQRAVVEILKGWDARMDSEIAWLKQAREVKAALISILLTGEVRVKPDEEAA